MFVCALLLPPTSTGQESPQEDQSPHSLRWRPPHGAAVDRGQGHPLDDNWGSVNITDMVPYDRQRYGPGPALHPIGTNIATTKVITKLCITWWWVKAQGSSSPPHHHHTTISPPYHRHTTISPPPSPSPPMATIGPQCKILDSPILPLTTRPSSLVFYVTVVIFFLLIILSNLIKITFS